MRATGQISSTASNSSAEHSDERFKCSQVVQSQRSDPKDLGRGHREGRTQKLHRSLASVDAIMARPGRGDARASRKRRRDGRRHLGSALLVRERETNFETSTLPGTTYYTGRLHTGPWESCSRCQDRKFSKRGTLFLPLSLRLSTDCLESARST